MKTLNSPEKRSFARKEGALEKTLERHLLYVNSRGHKGNNLKELLPRKGALTMTLRDSKVLERDPDKVRS